MNARTTRLTAGLALATAAGLGWAMPASAVTYCVGTVADLRSAAATISSTETAFDLRIKSGYYGFTASSGLNVAVRILRRYTSNTPAGQPHRISGSWNADCSQQAAEVTAGTVTVLDGQGVTKPLRIDRLNWLTAGSPDLEPVDLAIDRLQIANSVGTGLVTSETSTTSVEYYRRVNLTVDRVRMELSDGTGMVLGMGGTTVVRNSVFLGNQGNALHILGADAPIHIYQNTLRYNRNGPTPTDAQVYVKTTNIVYFYNNLIADGVYPEGPVELRIADGATFVRNNRFVGTVVQESPDLLFQSGNTAAVPQFVNAQNSHLLASSPLRDIGYQPSGMPGLGDVDFDGTARVQGAGPDIGAYELAPLTLLGPSLAYSPAAGASTGTGGPVAFTGVAAIGSTGSGTIGVTPSGGAGGGTTTLSAFTLSGADAGAFTRTSAATLTFTAGNGAAQNIGLSCTSGSTQRTANLQATETIANGATTQRFWVLVCPAGAAVGPSLGFNPAAGASAGTGGTVTFTGVSQAGSTGSGSITVTPSGGTGTASTTLSAFTLGGADAAAFTRTSAATLTFTTGNASTQAIAYTCTAGASQRTANLQATQTVAGGATTQRFWVLVCPAGTTSDSIFAGGFEGP